MCTMIAPAGAMPPSTPGESTVPAVLQPTGVGGVTGGGAAELQPLIEQLHGALGSVLGALEGAQAIGGGGGAAASGCGCSQASAGTGALGAPPAEQAAPAARDAPREAAPRRQEAARPREATGDWKAATGTKLTSPLPGGRLTSRYAEVSSIRNNRPHTGTDLAKPQGAPILAAAAGRVAKVGFQEGGLGHFIEIDHGNGWTTKYGHMVEGSHLQVGATVAAGVPIGKVGSTGNSTGPHLHFEVAKDGRHQNPEPFLDGQKTIG